MSGRGFSRGFNLMIYWCTLTHETVDTTLFITFEMTALLHKYISFVIIWNITRAGTPGGGGRTLVLSWWRVQGARGKAGSGRGVEELLDHLLHVLRPIFVVLFRVFGEGDVGTSGRTRDFLIGWWRDDGNTVVVLSSPLQERPVGLGHRRPLGPTDEVPLLLVRDGPAFLGLAQLLQAVIEALRRGGGGSEVRAAVQRSAVPTRGRRLTLNLSLMICRSLSFSCRRDNRFIRSVKFKHLSSTFKGHFQKFPAPYGWGKIQEYKYLWLFFHLFSTIIYFLLCNKHVKLC